jgi:hypothetical protein
LVDTALTLAALAVLAALCVLVSVDAAPLLRVPLTVVLLTAVPGLAFVGGIGDRSAAWVALVIAVSLAVSTFLSVALAWVGWMRPGPTVAAFAIACGPPLVARLFGWRR